MPRWTKTKMGELNRPDEIKFSPDKDSAQLLEAQIRWLNDHPERLAWFQKLILEKEKRSKKEQARRSGNTRRLRILENGYEPYSVTQVLLKYGKNCHICLTPIDLKASRRVGIGDWILGLHIDHLVAIAKGGADKLENVRPSHAICNLKKGIN